ncbi:hypothetical protein MBM09_08690 [Flaviramulus sp. BrNp1-15]|uniref:DUF6660 family protein n=1 Tax=Flavobacteriaceae TaxID=49546 RepID=UPI001EE8297C|nr:MULTISPECIES: DUF6660 family protein [Flavobacteriaceae]ULC57996.1 hypothetical protein MBM09_08690 [Flaviramulus sp. BrNp1-15]WGD34721.1 hypothetical protein Ollyesu_13140 [Olleya sp. YS]
MKFVTIILSLIILLLSAKPCSDGQNIEDQHQDEISVNHNHQEDSDDSCPVTCICNCCGMSITYEPIKTFNLKLNIEISSELISTYQPIYRFNFLSNIWQPPQVIS